jgi:hypothetical protein
MNKQVTSSPTGQEPHEDSRACESQCDPGCCCGLSGPGGRIRIALLVVVALVVVVLMVRGFAGAG